MKEKAPASAWILLLLYMFLNLMIQIQWVALAPISRAAAVFYQNQIAPDSFFDVDFMAMVYLIVFILVAFPASYILDTYGLKKGLLAGVVLSIAGAVLKGFFSSSYLLVLLGQILFALAQPLFLNAATLLSARYFPLHLRGQVVGYASLSQYLGIILAMILGPTFVDAQSSSSSYGAGVQNLLLSYGVLSIIAALCLGLWLLLAPANTEKTDLPLLGFGKGLTSLIRNRYFQLLLVLFTIGLGIFNAISSMVDTLVAHIGVQDSDGLLGAVMLLGGVLGAVFLPILSDIVGKRRPFLILCMAGMIPGVAGLAFAQAIGGPDGAYVIAVIASGILGFFVMSAGPIGFEYAAEVGHPAPESTSQGLLLLVGQISGIIFMAIMGVKTLIGPLLIAFCILAAIAFALTFFLKESLHSAKKTAE